MFQVRPVHLLEGRPQAVRLSLLADFQTRLAVEYGGLAQRNPPSAPIRGNKEKTDYTSPLPDIASLIRATCLLQLAARIVVVDKRVEKRTR